MTIEIHTNDKCNCNCRSCLHLSCIAKYPRFKSAIDFENDFKKIYSGFKNNVKCVRIMGGEPFLNADLLNIIKTIKNYFNEQTIELVSNGLFFLDEKFCKSQHCLDILNFLKNENIDLRISCHFKDFKTFRQIVIERLRFLKLGFFYEPAHIFTQIKVNKEPSDKIKNFESCPIKDYIKDKKCVQLVGTKLIRCPFAAYSYILNENTGLNYSLDNYDILDLEKIKSDEEIREFFLREIDYCKWCHFEKEKIFALSKTDNKVNYFLNFD